MHRGFGIDATTPVDVAQEVARRTEALGYDSFWVNGSPPREAIEILTAAAEVTTIPLGTGVIPLHRQPISDVIADVEELDLPTDRLWLGVGFGEPQNALAIMRDAVARIQDELNARAIMGAFGPNMTRLAGEISDGVLFTWWFRAAIEESRPLVKEGAGRISRQPPEIMSYIRCAILPDAKERLDEVAGGYDSSPRFRELFRRHGLTAWDTIVTGAERDDLLPGIEREEEVLDVSVIRAIVAETTVDHFDALLHACRPQAS